MTPTLKAEINRRFRPVLEVVAVDLLKWVSDRSGMLVGTTECALAIDEYVTGLIERFEVLANDEIPCATRVLMDAAYREVEITTVLKGIENEDIEPEVE